MYLATIYFAGPLSLWSGKPHAREILARRSARWRWLAMARAQAVLASVDSGRCGFVVTKGGEVIHHERAKDEQCNPLPADDDPFRGNPYSLFNVDTMKLDGELEKRARGE